MRLAEKVLDLARWAPSGDNTQPWRFEIASDSEILVHGYDTRTHCVYDLDGAASQVAHGTLLETAVLAATRYGCRAEIATERADPSGRIVYRLRLVPDPGVTEDPWGIDYERSVQRRPLLTRHLPPRRNHRWRLPPTVPDRLIDTFAKRWQMAALSLQRPHQARFIPKLLPFTNPSTGTRRPV
jgi:hypothetical protein